MKPKKCKLLSENTKYLGYIVLREGLTPDPAKVECVKSYPVPWTVTEVRRFIGMASYYRKFAPGFSTISSPLCKLTKKGVLYIWTCGCGEALNRN